MLAGDVWVASGQSNMEMEVKGVTNAQAEIAAANFPRIRLFKALNKVSQYPLEDIAAYQWGDSTWAPVSPDTVAGFSAAAYFFGRQIHQKEGVPVGLIETNWGGTPAEAWTSLTGLGADASLMPVFAEWGKMMDAQTTIELERRQEEQSYRDSVAKAQAEGRTPPERERRWHPNQDFCWQPAGLFNAMIAPLTRFPIRGAIWYQGESNAGPERAPLYARLFRTMIQDWRRDVYKRQLQEIGVAGRRVQRVLQKLARLPRFSIQFQLTDPVLQACIQSPHGAGRPQYSGNQR